MKAWGDNANTRSIYSIKIEKQSVKLLFANFRIKQTITSWQACKANNLTVAITLSAAKHPLRNLPIMDIVSRYIVTCIAALKLENLVLPLKN